VLAGPGDFGQTYRDINRVTVVRRLHTGSLLISDKKRRIPGFA
jgi:hypothetical protein